MGTEEKEFEVDTIPSPPPDMMWTLPEIPAAPPLPYDLDDPRY